MPSSATYPDTRKSVHDIPGRAMGIWAFVLAFLIPLLGLVLGIVAYATSRRAGVSNRLAVAGIVISAVFMVGAVIATIAVAAAGGF
ncbi:hypothetical protein [Agromyces sp. LHK192]|uniref:hypothetical protein n=1 Tax=Agromyces sp. LHK192 TaxID=2498704 RepID=UPI000FDC0451|nr:hypothetical protein [Agromyces sp. LHK192]